VLEACFADLLKGLVFDDEVMEWQPIRDNLRNSFLSPPAEMLGFLQQLREPL
jgi:hypothetical protein